MSISSLTLLILLQGAGSLFLALCLTTLWVQRRQWPVLIWGLGWLANGLWMLFCISLPLIGGLLALMCVVGSWRYLRQWKTEHRPPTLVLSVAMLLYGLDRLHLAQFFRSQGSLEATGSVPVVLTALVGFVIQAIMAAALVLLLLDAEQAQLRQTVDRLEESETQFRLIFEHSGVGMSLLSREGRFLAVNPALVRMLGFSDEELRGRRLSDMVHAQDVTHEAKLTAGDPNTETPSFYEREKRYLRKDGQPIWARVLRVPIRDAEGCTRHYVGVLVDITSRVKAEQQLAASEMRYRMLNQAARDGLLVMDDEATILEVNPAFCEMLSQPESALRGRRLLEVAGEPEVLREFLRRVGQRSQQRLETQLKRSDGSLLDVEISAADLELEGRHLLHGICRDISERKRSEESLREARERLRQERDFGRQILDSADVLLFVLNPAGRIIHFNAACSKVLGYSEAEVRDCPFWDVLLPERYSDMIRESHSQLLRADPQQPGASAAGSLALGGELYWRARDGGERLIAWRNTVVRGSRGQVLYVIGTGQDVTEQRQLEEQLRQARKMESLGTLVGGIAHDFNNQLTVVLGHLTLALAEAARDFDMTQHLASAEEAAQRCAQITQQLLTFAGGKVGPTTREDPGALLSDVAQELQREFPPSIAIRLEAKQSVWPLQVDAGQLRQILLDLATNARDAMPHGGTLTLTAINRLFQESDCTRNVEARPGRFVELTVADTGNGMTSEVLNHIFEPYFTTKDPGSSSGLGLAVVYGIIKAHGGWISVQSEPGQGSVFRLYLPAASGATPATEPALSPSLPTREQTSHGFILVVDDEDMVRGLAEAVLQREGYQVLQASCGEEALDLFREKAHEIALVLLDYSMPRMTGLQVMHEMQKIDPNVCVVFSSGYTRDSDTDQLLATGARAFVPKPYRPADLLETVRQVLGTQKRSAGSTASGGSLPNP